MTRERLRDAPVGPECEDFSLGELKAALRATKSKGAAGPDEICPQFLRNLKDEALNYVLGIFNESWVTGFCPQGWRDAVIVPVPKPGKPPGDISSFRPIALTSCLAKLMERLVANRLKHLAESAGLWCQDQAGFRAQRCSEDQVLKLSQSVFDGFQCKKPKRTVLALLDFSKAYDTIWKADLLDSMLKKGVPHRLVQWVKGFLTNRQAKVRLGGAQCKNRLFREGVPQGSVLAPLLFLFVIDTLRDRLPDGLSVSMYADDVAIWASDPDKGVAASLVEEGVRAVYQWSREKKLKLSIEKCEVSFFTSDTSEFGWKPTVEVEGRALPFNPTPKFLGVKYDRMFSFADQAREAASKMA
ncbi:MAG: reverse transcriptase family protein, partial [Cyanobacteria bacterium J06553_1]